ncbi:MAG: DUF1330 domain-containing protein [Sphingomicrobium sp.]
MPAFLVFIRDAMHDPDEFKIYAEKSGASAAGHPIKAHVFYGAIETLEGAPADGAVVIEFPDRAAARAWYDSPAYQEAKAHRVKAADYRVMLVDGVGG